MRDQGKKHRGRSQNQTSPMVHSPDSKVIPRRPGLPVSAHSPLLPCSLQHSSGGDYAILCAPPPHTCGHLCQCSAASFSSPPEALRYLSPCVYLVCHPLQAESLNVGLCSSLACLASRAPASVLSGVSPSLCAFYGFH